MADILTFVTLQASLSAGHPSALALALSESEVIAIFSAVEALLGDEEKKAELVQGFFSSEGEWSGVPCRLFPIVHINTY